MLRRWLVSALALCLVPVALSLFSVAGGSVIGTGRYIVVLKDSASASGVAGTATGLGATIDSLFGMVNTLVVSLPPLDVARLQRDPRVAYVTPDRPVRLLDSGASPASSKADSAATRPAVPTGVARIGASPALNPDGTVATQTAPAKKAAVALLD